MVEQKKPGNLALSGIGVEGFKSIRDRHDVELRQLTILAGANSSGKSSLMQPLLLLKQTVDASFDPGPLRLAGPNVVFRDLGDAVWRGRDGGDRSSVTIKLEWPDSSIEEVFGRGASGAPAIMRCRLRAHGRTEESPDGIQFDANSPPGDGWRRRRCWLVPDYPDLESRSLISQLWLADSERGLARLAHVAATRALRDDAYEVAAVGETYPGLFVRYVPSIVLEWQRGGDQKLLQLGTTMAVLGLTSVVRAERLDDTRIAIRVGRTLAAQPAGDGDLVNICHVGVGISQALPVVVALIAAVPGQVVYVEEPEIHLHPRAQSTMARVIADAAKRGVQVVIETHSELLLMGIQTLVARGELDPALVKLHWFERDEETGATTITSADLDENGAFGDWPEDFARVNLDAQRDYLDAARPDF